MQNHYLIKPLDTLFFGGSRPFSAGNNAVGQRSEFPPAPHTLVGAVRAQWAAQLGWPGYGSWDKALLAKLGGDNDQLSGLRFRGPELALLPTESTLNQTTDQNKQNSATNVCQPLFPAPAALIGVRQGIDSAPTHIARLSPCSEQHALQTDQGQMRMPIADIDENDTIEGRKTLAERYLTLTGLTRFLSGGVPDQAADWFNQAITHSESRVGNQIDVGSGRVNDGMLYSTQQLRLADELCLVLSLAQHNSAMTAPNSVALGGEGRAAQLIATDSLPEPDIDTSAAKQSGHYLVYLRTPLLIPEQQALPYPGKPLLDLPGVVVSACLYPAVRHSEWLQQHGQRQSRSRCVVPAGSVIFMQFDPTNDAAQHRFANLQDTPTIGQRSDWGYGHIALGNWQPTTRQKTQ